MKMENFDIEKLERRNIYTAPDDFFAEMQNNVLHRTVGADIKPVHKIESNATINSNKNWWYAAAAAIVMLFGFGFFYSNLNSNKENFQPQLAETTPIPETPKIEADEIIASEPIVAQNTEEDLTKTTVSHPMNRNVSSPVVAKTLRTAPAENVKVKTVSAESRAEEIISSLPQEDIMMLAKETEPDVYLELYN